MKLEVNLTKKKFLIIFLGILLSVGGVFVIAATPNPGHSGAQVDFSNIDGQDVNYVRNVYLSGFLREVSGSGVETGDYFGFSNSDTIVLRNANTNRLEVESDGDVNVLSRLCIRGDCRTSWGGTGGGNGCNLIAQKNNAGSVSFDVPSQCINGACRLFMTVAPSAGEQPTGMASITYSQDIQGIDARWWMAEGARYLNGNAEQVASFGRQGGARDIVVATGGLGSSSIWDDDSGNGGDNDDNSKFVLNNVLDTVSQVFVC